MPYTLDDIVTNEAKIKIIGVGGGGGNAIATMIEHHLGGVQFMVANTDKQALDMNQAEVKIQLGAELTRGLGAGANPEMGRKAAEESAKEIAEQISGADMVFIAAGMGGGTGTGAAPVIARIAKDSGALTVAVVTKPFMYEGKKKMRVAEQGIRELKEVVDALIVIPNDKLLELDANINILNGFKKANEVLMNAAQGITELITKPGHINVDFNDVRTVMSNRGRALMGIGVGTGDSPAITAVEKAISNPLLEDANIEGASAVLVNITCSPDLSLAELNKAVMKVHDMANEEAEIIVGSVLDPSMQGEVRATIIATGFEARAEVVQPEPETTTGSAPAAKTVAEKAVPMKQTHEQTLSSPAPASEEHHHAPAEQVYSSPLPPPPPGGASRVFERKPAIHRKGDTGSFPGVNTESRTV